VAGLPELVPLTDTLPITKHEVGVSQDSRQELLASFLFLQSGTAPRKQRAHYARLVLDAAGIKLLPYSLKLQA